MLKSIHPLLHADLLYALRAMGHGDRLVISDTNFPADSVACHTRHGRVIRLDGVDAPTAIEAILSVLPLDTFDEPAACRMAVVDAPDEIPDVQQAVQAVVNRAEARECPLSPIDRFAFYEQAKNAYAVVQTGEQRFYGCFLLTKGVVPPAD